MFESWIKDLQTNIGFALKCSLKSHVESLGDAPT